MGACPSLPLSASSSPPLFVPPLFGGGSWKRLSRACSLPLLTTAAECPWEEIFPVLTLPKTIPFPLLEVPLVSPPKYGFGTSLLFSFQVTPSVPGSRGLSFFTRKLRSDLHFLARLRGGIPFFPFSFNTRHSCFPFFHGE